METAKAALIGIISNFDAKFKIPFDAICRNLANREVADLSLSLLMRVSKYPTSRTLCVALICLQQG
jgi:hypothetical protein